jgi:hypothetical protein
MNTLRKVGFVPMFCRRSAARAFSNEAALHFRAFVPNAVRFRAFVAKEEAEPSDFYPIVYLRLQGWGSEIGLVYCIGETPHGIAIWSKINRDRIFVPIMPYLWTIRTDSGQYIKFSDGSWHCRSKAEGPLKPGKAIYFVSPDDANSAAAGRYVHIMRRPEMGLVPLGLSRDPVADGLLSGDELLLPRGGWRLGTPVTDLYVV